MANFNAPPHSLYCTFDKIDYLSGAGKVCIHEIQALKAVTDVKLVVSRGSISLGVPLKTIDVEKFYGFNPFLMDYFAADLIDLEGVDLAHLSCSPGNAVISKLRPKKYCVNIVAHDLKTSIEEHERILSQPYPFAHNVDPYLHQVLLKHAAKADAIITPSHGSATWIKDNIDVDGEKIHVIPHGCDLPEIDTPPPENFKVGYVGVFGPDKGVLYMLLALNAVGLSDVETVFAGRVCEMIDPWVREFVRPMRKITKMGWLESSSEFYNAVSIVCVPSVTEGFGLATLEAMSHGRPVIVSKGAGSSDLVTDGKDGFVIPPRDSKAIADRIQWFKDNPSEIKAMGGRARKTAEDYSWSKIEEAYRALYEYLLK